jgi:hypothetical protein
MVAPAFATLLELNADLKPKIGGSGFWAELSHNLTLLRRFDHIVLWTSHTSTLNRVYPYISFIFIRIFSWVLVSSGI